MAYPIWKDYTFNLGNGVYKDYAIEVDSVQVFAGRAYSKTGLAENIYVNINEIVADYFSRSVPNWGDPDPAAIPNILVNVKVGGTSVGTREYRPDWSYENGYVPEVDGMSFPVDGWITEGQTLLFSTLGNWTPTLRIHYMGERGDFAPWHSAGNGDFGDDFFISGWWQDVTLANYGITGPRVFAIDLSDYTNIYKVEIVGFNSWKVWKGCCRYVLHYMNAYGGWDSLLVRGNGKQTDTLKRYNRKVPYDNSVDYYRGTENYVNEIGAKYEFHPGPMTEVQAGRMWHLLNSVSVYLEDLEKGDIRPLVLTNATSEYKTWDNQGHRLIEYTIEAELAQDRLRR